jgi:hypothetical protein
MQPLPSGEDGCANGDKKSTAGTGPSARASGDRLFLAKCAEGKALSSCIRDRHPHGPRPACRGLVGAGHRARPDALHTMLHAIVIKYLNLDEAGNLGYPETNP